MCSGSPPLRGAGAPRLGLGRLPPPPPPLPPPKPPVRAARSPRDGVGVVAGVSERRTEEERERPLPRGMRGSCPHSFAPDPRGTAAMVGKLRGKAKRVSRDTREGLSRPAGTEREGSGGDTTRRSVPSRGDHGGGGGGKERAAASGRKLPVNRKKPKKLKLESKSKESPQNLSPPPFPLPPVPGVARPPCPAPLSRRAAPGEGAGPGGAGGVPKRKELH